MKENKIQWNYLSKGTFVTYALMERDAKFLSDG